MRKLAIGTSAALALALFSGGAALADAAERPSHIHLGTCPAPGDVIAPLSNVVATAGDAAGQASAIPVEVGNTVVELALADILAGDHSIVVHHSEDDMGTYLACGDIGGVSMTTPMGAGLAVGLAPVSESTFTGVASLVDNGDGTTSVTVFIVDSSAMMMAEG